MRRVVVSPARSPGNTRPPARSPEQARRRHVGGVVAEAEVWTLLLGFWPENERLCARVDLSRPARRSHNERGMLTNAPPPSRRAENRQCSFFFRPFQPREIFCGCAEDEGSGAWYTARLIEPYIDIGP
jgi:hypothetical protein